jgi:hypothetical protein
VIAATVEWLFGLQGPHGTGLDDYGEYDYLYRTTSPGFPTFASISGITSDGYGPTQILLNQTLGPTPPGAG